VPSLADVVAAVDAQHPWFAVEVGEPDGDGWVAGPAWLVDGAGRLGAQVDEIAAARQGDRHLGAVFLAGWYARAVAFPVVGSFLLTGAVPALGLDRLRVHRADGGWFDRFALAPGTELVAPGGALRWSSRGASRAERRALVGRVVAEHLDPIVEALRTLVPVGRRALWAAVTDAMGSSVLASAATLGDARRVAAEADEVFAAAPSELDPRPTWVWLDHEGAEHLFLRRAACCLAYRSPLHGWCSTCPLVPEAERIAELRAAVGP
jgi:ferric iron reductase protein FhuF